MPGAGLPGVHPLRTIADVAPSLPMRKPAAFAQSSHRTGLSTLPMSSLSESDNAFEQATSAASNLLGLPTPHDKVPWFWSDQYDIKLVIVGLTHDHDVVITRGDPASACFSACYLRQGELVAIDSVNSPKDQMAARKLIAERVRPDVTKLANPAIPLRDSV